jgi:F-type H+-transporting ATPase subunit b
LEGLGINLGYLFVQIISFLVVLVILHAWVYRPVLNMLQERRKKIAQGLEDARVASEARKNAEKEADSILEKAQEESNRVVSEGSQRAEQVALEIKQEAEQEAEQTRKAALAEAEHVKDQALGELRGQVAALAIAAAQKIVGEALDEKKQHQIIDEFFTGVRSGKVVVLGGEAISGASAEVTSALPLSEEEQDTVRSDIIEQLGPGAAISFRVDPNILGGLIIRVGDKVIDGSVSGKLTELQQSLN